MGNTSIYIKDQDLLQRAKKLAGEEGFSAFITKALEDFVERKQDEARGLADHSIYIATGDPEYDPLIRFKGRSVATRLIGRGPDEDDAEAEIYKTKAGKLVLVLRDVPSGEAYEYRVYESLKELALDSDALAGIPHTYREEFIDDVARAMGEKWAIWID